MGVRKYQTPKAFRQALEEKIKTTSKKMQMDLQRVRRTIAFDRFLCRMFIDPKVKWVLKGGYAMELRVETARATKDIDFTLGKEFTNQFDSDYDANQVLWLLKKSMSVDLEDYFIFKVGEPMRNLENAPYGGYRYPVHSMIDNRTFVKFHIDVSLGDQTHGSYEYLEGQDWLAFAGIPTQKFLSISAEQQFTEKLHAYTIPRGDRPNSRIRDLIDIALLIDQGKIKHKRLMECIKATFKRRKTHAMPDNLQEPPEFWKDPFAQMAKKCQIDPDIGVQFKKLKNFLQIVREDEKVKSNKGHEGKTCENAR